MIFCFVLLFCLLVVPVSLMLLKGIVSRLERRYEERQSKKYHSRLKQIVQEGSRHRVAIHLARMANEPEYRARNEAYIIEVRRNQEDK